MVVCEIHVAVNGKWMPGTRSVEHHLSIQRDAKLMEDHSEESPRATYLHQQQTCVGRATQPYRRAEGSSPLKNDPREGSKKIQFARSTKGRII